MSVTAGHDTPEKSILLLLLAYLTLLPEDGNNNLPRKVDALLPDYTTLSSSKRCSS
jgi:hypothetical protein